MQKLIDGLRRPVSTVRLNNYRTPGGTDLDMVVNYFHNIQLSEALYPLLQAFEIALRNSTHDALAQHFQTPYWFDTPHLFPQGKNGRPSRQESIVIGARRTLVQAGKDVTADRIVAELHFGFWHSMFNSPFEQMLWRPDKSALIGKVFPGAPRRERHRQAMWDRIDRIRIIRNRVMHYEPIWNRPRLDTDHAMILQSLDWISVEGRQVIESFDRFPQTLASRSETEATLRRLSGSNGSAD